MTEIGKATGTAMTESTHRTKSTAAEDKAAMMPAIELTAATEASATSPYAEAETAAATESAMVSEQTTVRGPNRIGHDEAMWRAHDAEQQLTVYQLQFELANERAAMAVQRSEIAER